MTDTAAQRLGRPTLLTEALMERLCSARKRGHSVNGVAAACYIHRSTLRRWLAKGAAELEALDAEAAELEDVAADPFEEPAPQTLDDEAAEPSLSVFARFYLDFEEASSKMFEEVISGAYQHAVGGTEIERGTRPDGTEYVKYQPPDGRVGLDFLSRLAPDDWRPVKAVEVSGPAGGPMEVAFQADVVEGILGKVSAAKERREQAAASAFGGPVIGADDEDDDDDEGAGS